MGVLDRILRAGEGKKLKALQGIVPDIGALEDEYRTRLRQDFGIEFNHLFCLTNCPVGRYLDFLNRS